ncbi:hypothetical protein D3C73_1602300 [compost metagenome]
MDFRRRADSTQIVARMASGSGDWLLACFAIEIAPTEEAYLPPRIRQVVLPVA